MRSPRSRARSVVWGCVRELMVLSLLIPSVGCGADEKYAEMRGEVAPAASPAPARDDTYAAKSAPGEEKATGAAGQTPAVTPRKIVFNGSVTLIVESLSAFEAPFAKLVKDSDAFISQSDRSNSTDKQGRGTWTVRVPVEMFEPFLKSLGRLGELQQSHIDSQDVTQEYYDIEARISNKQQEEKRLLKHLSDSTGKLEDILVVEREISRVRGEIEQMQGRIRFLANVTSMSTVTLTVTEIHNYVPPVAPTFAAQVVRSFQGSLDNLISFGQGLVILGAAIAPWLPILLIAALILVWLVRRFRILPARAASISPPVH